MAGGIEGFNGRENLTLRKYKRDVIEKVWQWVWNKKNNRESTQFYCVLVITMTVIIHKYVMLYNELMHELQKKKLFHIKILYLLRLKKKKYQWF